MQKNSNIHLRNIILTMIRFSLLEIRASNNIELSKSLADIFHKAPSFLMSGADDEKCVEALSDIYKRAETHKMLNFIKSLEEAAKKSSNIK